MKVQLITTNCYQVKAGEKDLGTFTEKSSWQGMLELVNQQGQQLIVESPGPFQMGFMASLIPKSSVEVEVVKVSPTLAGEILGAKA